jgi:hypothetical protein
MAEQGGAGLVVPKPLNWGAGGGLGVGDGE